MRLLTRRTTVSRLRKLTGGEQGASLVETGLAMLILMPLLLGAIEFSLVFFAYHEVTDAARVATRWAAVRGSTSCSNTPNLTNCGATATDIQNYVQGLGYPGLVSSNIQVSASWLQATSSIPTSWSACSTGTCNAPGNQVQVTVSYVYPIVIPYWKKANINITSTSAMAIAQ